MRARAYRAAEASRHSLRNGFTTYNELSPVTGFLATVISGTYRKLDASTGASGPHVFAVRLRAVRQKHIGVHRIPPRAYDDRETPLVPGRDQIDIWLIWVWRQAEILKTRTFGRAPVQGRIVGGLSRQCPGRIEPIDTRLLVRNQLGRIRLLLLSWSHRRLRSRRTDASRAHGGAKMKNHVYKILEIV